MNRDYADGQSNNVVFFTGKEIERTPAYGMDTFFVVGVHPIDVLKKHLAVYPHIKHIFFGANHSFDPETNKDWNEWDDMLSYFLNEGYLCSIDIPLSAVEFFHDSSIAEFNNLIPQIRVPIPYITLWNYNTMIKFDDKDFDHSNPGVWTHSLHNLMDRECFTSWAEYSLDKPVE